ncbi:hypothetical protein BaRGS_00021623, partial [Batillaria attramentaria]
VQVTSLDSISLGSVAVVQLCRRFFCGGTRQRLCTIRWVSVTLHIKFYARPHVDLTGGRKALCVDCVEVSHGLIDDITDET